MARPSTCSWSGIAQFDIKAAQRYAERLKALAAEVSDSLYLVMRVCIFEKPQTTVGWKADRDPFMDDSFKIQASLHR
jgi:3-deoxy-7-phosphoheptulonate synthase